MLEERAGLVHDWNQDEVVSAAKHVEFFDETLRDGLQAASLRSPDLEARRRTLHFMSDLGIHTANIGFVAASKGVLRMVVELGKEIRDQRLSVKPACVGRTTLGDMTEIVRASDEVGIPYEACCFIGSSEMRRTVEDWDLDRMVRHTEEAVRFVVDRGLPVMYVTEDTTRAHPETLALLYKTAIRAGARRICACDTVGHSTPSGVRRLVQFLRELADETGEDIKIDWHGHNDRGLALVNALVALESGADRLEATILGIGERCGNTSLDQLLVNLSLMGAISNDLTKLHDYCRFVSEAVRYPIAVNYPMFGADAFRTTAGVHSSAIVKALAMKDEWLANRVYSGVPADMLGRSQEIGIGPMSGRSNVVHWLKLHRVEASEEVVERVLRVAKESETLLTDEQIAAAAQRP